MVYARYNNTFDAGTQGAQITAANSGASGTAFTRAFGAGTSAYDSGSAFQGAMGMLPEATSSQSAWQNDFGAVAAAGFSLMFRMPSLPGADFGLGRLLDSSGTRLVSVSINGANKLRIADATGSTGVWNATNALVAGTWYRVELWAKAGTSATTGEIRGAYFEGGSTTPVETFTSTSLNASIGTPFAQFIFGRITASAIRPAFDVPVWETDGAGLPGPYVAPASPLATPVVTLGTRTNPSTTGGTNGRQAVTWPAVTDAASYEAWLAAGSSPAQGDFVRVATGVASPYEFTNLAAGTFAYGIKAKA